MRFNSLENDLLEIKNLLKANEREPRESQFEPKEWPMSSMAQFDCFEVKLKNDNLKDSVIQTLRRQKSNNLGQSVRNCLKKTATADLWSFFNMEGRNEKKSFKGTALCSIITCVCRTDTNTDKEIESEIGKYLKSTPFKKGVKNQKKTETTLMEIAD
ncbi:uncharacterized protein [Antedon mediterranea]|uniref:uncharacterized protein n=1 Tax=Antedon mediterranea TaxID=105859 RepID=UPI003AF4CC93